MKDQDVAVRIWSYSQALESQVGELLMDDVMINAEGEYKVLLESYYDELKATIDRMRDDAMRIYDREEAKVKNE